MYSQNGLPWDPEAFHDQKPVCAILIGFVWKVNQTYFIILAFGMKIVYFVRVCVCVCVIIAFSQNDEKLTELNTWI